MEVCSGLPLHTFETPLALSHTDCIARCVWLVVPMVCVGSGVLENTRLKDEKRGGAVRNLLRLRKGEATGGRGGFESVRRAINAVRSFSEICVRRVAVVRIA